MWQSLIFSTLCHTWPVCVSLTKSWRQVCLKPLVFTVLISLFHTHIHMHPCWLTQSKRVAVRTDWEPALGHSSPCSGVPVYSTNSRTQGPVSDYLSFHRKHALDTAPLILNNHLGWNHLIRLSVPAIYSCFLLYIYTTSLLVSCIMLHLYTPQITLTFAKMLWITVIKFTVK